MAAPAIIMAFISRKGFQKAVEKYGKAAVRKAQQASKKVDDALDKAQGVKPSSPGRRTDSIIVGKKRVNAAQRGATTKGAAIGTAGGYAAGAGNKSDYSAANVDLSGGKGSLPLADMSQSIDARGDDKGMRYFQGGKEVRLPK
tara:strand:- start:942 stop:1370 length:429 start_codon:yes stop_codon:yes gene_type:complete